MTPPTLTPAEQIARFIERHPGEWRAACLSPVYPCVEPNCGELGKVAVLYLPEDRRVRLIPNKDNVGIEIREYLAPWQIWPRVDEGAPLLTRIATRIADVLTVRGGSADTLPPWLADPVRHQLINRARVLFTSAGISPADAVMAAETLDEALCQRAPVAPTLSAVLAALQAIGMSCRWIRNPGDTGINPERAAIKQALADLDAYSETDKGVRIATLPARAALRRVLGVA